ncbi:MAG: stalk domain-containing protein [Bacillota bacterium]|nr:stalk domain-containing protein [Bacillota bacterium]
MRKLLAIILTLAMLIPFSIPVFAEDEIKVSVDGAYLKFDVPPAIINGRTLVPIRAIFESMGMKVKWISETQTICGTGSDFMVIMQINNSEAKFYLEADYSSINESTPYESIKCDVPPSIIGGRTLVPVRALAEMLESKVTWDASSKTVIVERPFNPTLTSDGGYVINEQSVRFIGRYYIGKTDQLYYSSFTASGIEFRFNGTEAEVELTSNHRDVKKSDTYIHVFVDGNETLSTDYKDDSRILLAEGKSKITVAKALTSGEHTVKILKSNEDRYNQIGWGAVYTDGKLISRPAPRVRKIQIFGDSVASACNNVNYSDNNDAATLGTPYQDGLLSYGSFIGRHFNADVEFFCCSGLSCYGVFNTASANTSYDYVGPFSGNSSIWDHTKFEPDLIIQNTWVNDNNQISVYNHKPEELYPTYLRMFKDLRKDHPQAKILIISSTNTTDINNIIQSVIDDLKKEGENGITLFKTSIPFTRHPLSDKHQQMAEELYPVIENLMGWQ